MGKARLRSTENAKPKRVALFGATGAYGNGVLRRALAMGVEVVVILRNPDKLVLPEGAQDVTVIKAELDDTDAITEALRGVDGVISGLSMGVKAKRGALSPKSKNVNIYRAMKAAGVRKFVVVSAISCPVPGEGSKPGTWIRYVASRLFLPLGLLKENSVERDELFSGANGSDQIDWVMARAARVDTERKFSGAEVSENSVVSFVSGAEDVGDFCLFAVASDEFNGKAPFVGSPRA